MAGGSCSLFEFLEQNGQKFNYLRVSSVNQICYFTRLELCAC